MKRVLVTGAVGQIGSELVVYLRGILGNDNVVPATRSRPIRPSGNPDPFISSNAPGLNPSPIW